MKTLLSLLLALTAPVAPLVRAADAPAAASWRMYAALAMTKAQKNSATPTDSGLYVREADGAWRHFGPRVLGVFSMAVQPGSHGRVMLTAAADGVLRSTDAGKTWRLTTGWQVEDVRTFAFNPANPDEIYASTCWGPLRSTDGGASWQLALAGLNLYYCQSIVADSRTPGRVLVGTEDGVYLSTDGAKTWTRADSPPALILRLKQSEADPNLMLAGTRGRGAWLSHDAGRSWTQTDPASDQADLYGVALDRQDAKLMATGGWGTGVRVSTDGGTTWQDRSAGLPLKDVFVVAFDPGHAGRLWASTFQDGSFYSDDLGRTWHDGGLYGAYGSDYIFVSAEK